MSMKPLEQILISISCSMFLLAGYHFFMLPVAIDNLHLVSGIYTVNLKDTTNKVKEEMLARTLKGETPDPMEYRKRIAQAFNEMLKSLPARSVVLEEESVVSGMAGRLNLLGKNDDATNPSIP